MANVNGNFKNRKRMRIKASYSLGSLGKISPKKSKITAMGSKAKVTAQKGAGQIARNYKRYIGPTTKLLRGAGKFAMGAGKLALRFPGTGLALTGAYYGGKALVKKGERVARRSATKQWHKRDRFGRTRWYL